MKQQLAVEWLIDEIRKLSHNENHHLGMGDIRISQAVSYTHLRAHETLS
jgi:hypothetical protein